MRSGYKIITPGWLLESLQRALFPSTWMITWVVHGSYWLPAGYSLPLVPSDARVINGGYIRRPHSFTTSSNASDWSLAQQPLSLSAVYNLPKAIIGIGQVVTAAYTLYQARGTR